MSERERGAVWASAAGALLAAASCVPMLAATATAPLALVGVAVQSGWFADTVDQLALPVLRPLLIGSLVLIVIGLAPRGRIPIALAALGGPLVYLAMFVLPSGSAAMLDMGMSTTEPEALGLVVFWLGVLAIGAAFSAAYRRSPAAVPNA